MTHPGYYGRYEGMPDLVGCPRAMSLTSPCIARDGRTALYATRSGVICLSCARSPLELLADLEQKSGSRVVLDLRLRGLDDSPPVVADQLRQRVREVTDPNPPSEVVAAVVRRHLVDDTGLCLCGGAYFGRPGDGTNLWARWPQHVAEAIAAAIGPTTSEPALFPAGLRCAGGCGREVSGEVPTDVPEAGAAILRTAAVAHGWSTAGKTTDFCPECTDRRNGRLSHG